MTALARIPRNTEIVEVRQNNQWIDLVRPAADLAQEIAATDFVPKEMRNRPAMIAACILFGAELGLGPMVSLSKIAIVQGRPAPYAELARALALGAGHEIWVDEQTNTRCKVSGRRRGSQQIYTATWTGDDVKRAGISNQNYAKYPRQMLLARASAELVRMMCPDVLGGITVFAEEAADEPVDGPTVTATASEPTKAATRRRASATPATPATAEPEAPLLPDEEPVHITEAQIKKMMATFNDLNIRERDDRLAFIAAAVHPVETSKDLTMQEAGAVIDALDKVASGELDIILIDGGIRLQPADDQPPLPDEG